MKNLELRIIDLAALLLEPAEREGVVGDLIESEASTSGALLEVFGLVIRRQLAQWKSWRPWLAAVGVSLPSSLLLMGFSVSLSLGYLHFAHALTSATGPTLSREFFYFTCRIFLLIAWSWAAGFAVGSISRQSLLLSLISTCLPCLFCFSEFGIESLSRLSLLIFLPFALWGVLLSLRKTRLSLSFALSFTAAATIIMIFTWDGGSSGWLNPRTWVINTLLSWPTWYLVATAKRPKNNRSVII